MLNDILQVQPFVGFSCLQKFIPNLFFLNSSNFSSSRSLCLSIDHPPPPFFFALDFFLGGVESVKRFTILLSQYFPTISSFVLS